MTASSTRIIFPTDIDNDVGYKKLRSWFGSVEDIEAAFGIEFSCGDGLFMSDLWAWSGDSLQATVPCEIMYKYDGCVCLRTPPRRVDTKKLLKAGQSYRFEVRHYPRFEETAYFLNGKETSRAATT
jgi:hypothetical protein